MRSEKTWNAFEIDHAIGVVHRRVGVVARQEPDLAVDREDRTDHEQLADQPSPEAGCARRVGAFHVLVFVDGELAVHRVLRIGSDVSMRRPCWRLVVPRSPNPLSWH